jgi:hypothetical protein
MSQSAEPKGCLSDPIMSISFSRLIAAKDGSPRSGRCSEAEDPAGFQVPAGNTQKQAVGPRQAYRRY